MRIPREAIAAILEREIARRERGAEEIAEQIASAGLMTEASAARRIRAIVNATDSINGQGFRSPYQFVTLHTADTILTALDLNPLWHTEPALRDAA